MKWAPKAGFHIALCLVLASWLGTAPPVAASQISGAAQRAAAKASQRAAAKAAKSARVTRSAVPDKVVATYSTPLCKPSTRCPLPESVSNSFMGAYQQKTLSQDTVFYRVYADPARTLGAPKAPAVLKKTGNKAMGPEAQYSYWSRHDVRGYQAAIDAGLEVSKYGNTAGRQVAIRVPRGASVFEGQARGDVSSVNQVGRLGEGARHNPIGGGNQIVIKDVPQAWIIQP